MKTFEFPECECIKLSRIDVICTSPTTPGETTEDCGDQEENTNQQP